MSLKLDYLIEYLLNEDTGNEDLKIPEGLDEKKQLFRALMNVRPPNPISQEFLKIQDEYFKKNLIRRRLYP